MNTAGRLLSTLDRFLSHQLGNNAPMLNVWAQVFELPNDDPQLEDAVVQCLQATRAEIDLLRARLQSMGAPDELMQPGLARLRSFASPAQIHTQWGGFREEAAKPENRLVFMWASWVLRDEDEEEMAEEQLSALKDELRALEASVKSTEMTPYLRSFIQRQIDAIKTALRLYPVRGVKPIEEAARVVVGSCNLEAQVLAKEFANASEPAKTVFTRAGQFIEKTAKVADNLDKIRKAGEGAYALASSVAPTVLSWGQAWLPG
jgi:hypothetical protein